LLTLLLTPVWIAAPSIYRERWANVRARLARQPEAPADEPVAEHTEPVADNDDKPVKKPRKRKTALKQKTKPKPRPTLKPIPDAAE
jgi:hypothetical protein